jgi:hypothetical protein
MNMPDTFTFAFQTVEQKMGLQQGCSALFVQVDKMTKLEKGHIGTAHPLKISV